MFFCFKQKTAYEMRISDWSSDVCSSDLALRTLKAQRIGHGVRCLEDPGLVAELRERQIPLEVCPTSNVCLGVASSLSEHPLPRLLDEGLRSAERRVGKECVSTCRSRWSPDH